MTTVFVFIAYVSALMLVSVGTFWVISRAAVKQRESKR